MDNSNKFFDLRRGHFLEIGTFLEIFLEIDQTEGFENHATFQTANECYWNKMPTPESD